MLNQNNRIKNCHNRIPEVKSCTDLEIAKDTGNKLNYKKLPLHPIARKTPALRGRYRDSLNLSHNETITAPKPKTQTIAM